MKESTPKKKRGRKPKISEEQLQMARRYEMAWYALYYKKPAFAQKLIVEEPNGRHANDLTKEVRKLAESNRKIELVDKAKNYLEASGKFY